MIGISGGLDSTHAVIVAARAMDVLGLPRSNILAYTMPGFATSQRTLANAKALMQTIGCAAEEIDIRPSCEQMLRDIGHPYTRGEPVYDITFENVQAGERTSHLFRLANLHQGLVIGTGDLSELALGWCTYGVGDHMSHYGVNASVPKTLIQFLIRWVADTNQLGKEPGDVLRSILDTEYSPELIPGDPNCEQPTQRTEDMIGPYELQDFNLYYTLRFGYPPSKIAFLSYCAWRDRNWGHWPDIPESSRNQYTIGEIKRWLAVFAWRFFQLSQFKRSCIPNAPKLDRAVRSHRAAIIARPAIAKPPFGSKKSSKFLTPIRVLKLKRKRLFRAHRISPALAYQGTRTNLTASAAASPF